MLTGAIAACYAPTIFFTTLLQKATLGFFLTTVVLSLLSRIVSATRASHPLGLAWPIGLLGLTLGLLALTRENALVFIVLIALWLIIQYRSIDSRTLAVWVGVLILGASLPLAGVGTRNYVVGGDFTLTTSQFGTNFFIGNNAISKGFYLPLRFFRGTVKHEQDDAVELAEEAMDRKLTPGEVSAYWTDQAVDYIQHHPIDWLGLMMRKALLVWNRVEAADTEDIAAYRDFSVVLNVLSHVFHLGIMVPLAAAGLWLTRMRWRELWLLYLMAASYAASLTLFFLFARYRIPLVPMTLMFAAVGLIEIRKIVASRDRRAQRQTAIVVGCAAIMANLPLTDTDTQLAASYMNFATVMVEDENFGKAVDYLERSLEYRPDELPVMRWRAEALADDGRYSDSRQAYESILAIDSDHFLANLGLGRVLLFEGEFQAGIVALERAAELESTRSEPLVFLAMHYDGQKQISRARLAYLRILEREPENERAKLRVRQIEQKIRRLKEAHGRAPFDGG